MAQLNLNEGEQLINLLRPGPAATQDANNLSDTENLFDKLYKSLNQNITNCEYFEVNSQIVNGFYDERRKDDALILMHVNIRSPCTRILTLSMNLANLFNLSLKSSA